MDDRSQSAHRRQRSRDPLERRMDQWFETGRQFVDGVAGNRPGQRRKDNFGNGNRPGLEHAGRWVGEKLDWFFEEEEDWSDLSEPEDYSQMSDRKTKKPLKAISLRIPKALSPSNLSDSVGTPLNEWPDDSSFRIDRWQRIQTEADDEVRKISSPNSDRQRMSSRRPLPRSSRRRD